MYDMHQTVYGTTSTTDVQVSGVSCYIVVLKTHLFLQKIMVELYQAVRRKSQSGNILLRRFDIVVKQTTPLSTLCTAP